MPTDDKVLAESLFRVAGAQWRHVASFLFGDLLGDTVYIREGAMPFLFTS